MALPIFEPHSSDHLPYQSLLLVCRYVVICIISNATMGDACMMQVVAEYLMIVDASHGVLDGSAAPGSGRAAGSAPRKAAERSPRIAEQPLRLYNEGHPLPAIAQMLVSSLRT